MSSHADPALVDRRSSRATFRFEHSLRIFILVAVLSLFYPFTSSAADSPPLFLSSSPALRTARDRSTLRPQSTSGWYYAEDSRHWYYQLPSSSETLKTGWHHDVDGFTYYFDPSDGHMLAGAHQIDGIEYRFLSERDRGNYHQDHFGAWFYQANGLAPYGSLLSSHARSDHTHSPAAARPADADRDASLIDSSEIVTDRITIPPKASPSELRRGESTASPSETKREEIVASPSELPHPEDAPATPSEPPRAEEIPPTTSETETPDPPTPPEDERRHSHTEDPSVRCIAHDDWSTILAHRDAYSDCIEQHCTARLDLCGPAISQPLPSADTATQHYPLYVSLVDDRDGELTLAQAYAIPELNAVPMYVGTSEYPGPEDAPVYRQTNRGGLLATWLFRMLSGSRDGQQHSFYLEEADGTRILHTLRYPGYQIRIPDEAAGQDDARPSDGAESHGGSPLPLQKSVKRLSQGYQLEGAPGYHTKYLNYLSGKRPKESSLTQLCSEKQSSAALWFPSAQELHDYTLTETDEKQYTILDEDGVPLLSMFLRSEHCLPALIGSWRSAEAYWLRSTPSAYAREEICDDLGLTDDDTRAAVPLDEYFLQADADGRIHAAHSDVCAAVRLTFTVGG